MNITTKQVLKYFLRQYLQNKLLSPNTKADNYFEGFFLREELIRMIQYSHDGVATKAFGMDKMNNNELLCLLKSEDILSYFFETWKMSNDINPLDNPDILYETLEQLGNQTSYLAEKDMLNWDAYDLSNYRSMLLKAGKARYVYGLFDKEIDEKQALELNPINNRFYANTHEIERALTENENLSGKRVHAILISN